MKRSSRSRGTILVWMAIIGPVVIGLVGLACDAALVLLTAHELQNAADAAALAAAQQVRVDQTAARQTALRIAELNTAATEPVLLRENAANDPGGDVVFGIFDVEEKTFTPTTEGPNAVQVVARRTQDSLGGPLRILFGRIFGITTVDVSRPAVAMATGEIGYGLLVLCPDCECALELTGDTDFQLEGGLEYEGRTAIQVNSEEPCAACGQGSSISLQGELLSVVGGACWNGSPTLDLDINTGAEAVPDPLADLPDPAWSPGADRGAIRGSGTYSPGYYSGGIRMTSDETTVILEPGVYVLDGEGLFVNGGNLIAHDVIFYVKGTGKVFLAGNGIVELSPPEWGTYEGVTVFQARDNTNTATIVGGSNMNLEGTYYFPNAHLDVSGSGLGLGNQLISWTAEFRGSGVFDVTYNGNFALPGNYVLLVR